MAEENIKKTSTRNKPRKKIKPSIKRPYSKKRKKPPKQNLALYILSAAVVVLAVMVMILLGRIFIGHEKEFNAETAENTKPANQQIEKEPSLAPESPLENKGKIVPADEKTEHPDSMYKDDDPALERRINEKHTRPSGASPKVAIVIDDCGGNLVLLERLINLQIKTTPAILPHLQHSSRTYDILAEHGISPMLHQPMEPSPNGYSNGKSPGRGAIYANMKKDEIFRTIDENINSMGNFSGANNHMGSLVTADIETMLHVLTYFRERGMFFLDSRTTHLTVVPEIASQIGLPYLERDIFLDNEKKKSAIRKNILLLIQKAHEKGYAVGIGHLHKTTLDALDEFSREVHEWDVEFVYITDILLIAFELEDTV